MGLIGLVLSFVRVSRNAVTISDVKTDPGGGPNITPEHFSAPGDDSHPLPGDYVYAGPTPQRGKYAAIGYMDPTNTPTAQPGDKRIYGRDSDSGAEVVQVWLQNDGTAIISNDNGSVTLRANGSILGQNSAGSFELEQGGDFVVNGVTIAANGDVTIPSSLTLNGKEIAEHVHSQGNDSAGNSQQDTDPNL